jgi:hypothetical protein
MTRRQRCSSNGLQVSRKRVCQRGTRADAAFCPAALCCSRCMPCSFMRVAARGRVCVAVFVKQHLSVHFASRGRPRTTALHWYLHTPCGRHSVSPQCHTHAPGVRSVRALAHHITLASPALASAAESCNIGAALCAGACGIAASAAAAARPTTTSRNTFALQNRSTHQSCSARVGRK